LIFVFVAGYAYVRLEGRHLFESQLTKFFGQPAEIGEIRYLLPFGVRAADLKIQNILEAEDVRLHLRIPFLFKKRFVIARLEMVRPVFHFVRHDKNEIDFGGTYLQEQEKKFRAGNNEGIPRPVNGIIIDFLSIQDGRVEILDLSAAEPVKYDAGSLTGKAMKITYPLEDRNIKFDLQGEILGAGSRAWMKQGAFDINGWINWLQRSMEASVGFRGKGDLTADLTLTGKENVVRAKGRMEFGLVEKENVEKAKMLSQQEGIAGAFFGVLQASRSRLGMNFSFETLMDDFVLKVVDFDGTLSVTNPKKGLGVLNPASFLGIAGKDDAQK
jgi:hypothetical protein